MIFLVDHNAYERYRKKCCIHRPCGSLGFQEAKVYMIAVQPPSAIDVSAFYVMHGIIETKKHKQVLIIPTHKTILSTLNNALHVILIQRCLLPVYVAVRYK